MISRRKSSLRDSGISILSSIERIKALVRLLVLAGVGVLTFSFWVYALMLSM